MPTQKARFQPPAQVPKKRRTTTRIFQPVAGFHGGIAPTNLPEGFTPSAQNFENGPGYITPRSGLSVYDAGFSFGDAVLGGKEVFDTSGNLGAFAGSKSTIAFIEANNKMWSALSYIAPTTMAAATPPTTITSGSTREFWDATSIYYAAADRNIAVFTQGADWMGWFAVEPSTSTYSAFTWTEDLASTKYAKSIEAINDRLVLFNTTDTSDTKYPTRLLWSARGGVTDFLVANGAGFEDKVEMKGDGKKVIEYRGFLLLFTEKEIWKAQPTLDDYAFRITRVDTSLGSPFPRTVVSTPLGVIFLSADLEVYITDGVSVKSLGAVGGQGPSRIQRLIKERLATFYEERIWATYNSDRRRYELYIPTAGDEWPTEALYFDVDENSWFPQVYTHELSFGLDIANPGTSITWGELGTWASVTSNWADLGRPTTNRQVMKFGSAGTVYRTLSGQTTDDGTAIDARWKSHGLRKPDAMGQTAVSEVWIDYESDSASSASIYVGSVRSGSDLGSGYATSLISTNVPAFVPVWATDATPAFELRLNDGGQPRIQRFQVELQDAGRFR